MISSTFAVPALGRRLVEISGGAAYDARLVHVVENIKQFRARSVKRGTRPEKALDGKGRSVLEAELRDLAEIRAAHLAQRINNRKGHAIFASLQKSRDVSAFMVVFRQSDPWGSLIIKEHARPYDEKKPWSPPPKLEALDLAKLHELTRNADARMRKNKGGRRHSGREITIIRALARLWLEYTGCAPSPGAKEHDGPFIRFLKATNQALNMHLSPNWRLVRNSLKENPKRGAAG